MGVILCVYFLVIKKGETPAVDKLLNSNEDKEDKDKKSTTSQVKTNTNRPNIKPNVGNVNTNSFKTQNDEVYSTTKNIWTYDDAEAVCKSQGAELASYDQLVKAAENGAHWCNLGWVKSETTNDGEPFKYAHYPVQRKEFNEVKKSKYPNKCGQIWNTKYDEKPFSIQGGAYNKNNLLAVNCIGPKRQPLIDEKRKMERKEQLNSQNDEDLSQKISDI